MSHSKKRERVRTRIINYKKKKLNNNNNNKDLIA